MIIPILIFGGIAALVLYEKTKGGAHKKGLAAPALPPPPYSPGVIRNAVYVPPTPPTPINVIRNAVYVPPPVPADNVNTASQISGVAKSLLAESQNPILDMFPQHQLVKQLLQGLINTPTMANLDATIDRLRSPGAGQEGMDRGNSLSELRGHLTSIHTQHVGQDAGFVYEDHMAGGAPNGMIPASELPRIVMHYCALVLAQANGGNGGASPAPPFR